MMRWAVASAAVTCALGMAVTACSDSKSKESAASTTSTTARPGAVIKTSNDPRTSGFVGARADVSDLTCVKAGDAWKVAGNVKNPASGAVDYRIFTSFLDGENRTAGLVQTDVKGVAAGASKAWSGELAIPQDGLHCVLRVERTDAGAP